MQGPRRHVRHECDDGRFCDRNAGFESVTAPVEVIVIDGAETNELERLTKECE